MFGYGLLADPVTPPDALYKNRDVNWYRRWINAGSPSCDYHSGSMPSGLPRNLGLFHNCAPHDKDCAQGLLKRFYALYGIPAKTALRRLENHDRGLKKTLKGLSKEVGGEHQMVGYIFLRSFDVRRQIMIMRGKNPAIPCLELSLIEQYAPKFRQRTFGQLTFRQALPEAEENLRLYKEVAECDEFLSAMDCLPDLLAEVRRWKELPPKRRSDVVNGIFAVSSIIGQRRPIDKAVEIEPECAFEFDGLEWLTDYKYEGEMLPREFSFYCPPPDRRARAPLTEKLAEGLGMPERYQGLIDALMASLVHKASERLTQQSGNAMLKDLIERLEGSSASPVCSLLPGLGEAVSLSSFIKTHHAQICEEVRSEAQSRLNSLLSLSEKIDLAVAEFQMASPELPHRNVIEREVKEFMRQAGEHILPYKDLQAWFDVMLGSFDHVYQMTGFIQAEMMNLSQELAELGKNPVANHAALQEVMEKVAHSKKMAEHKFGEFKATYTTPTFDKALLQQEDALFAQELANADEAGTDHVSAPPECDSCSLDADLQSAQRLIKEHERSIYEIRKQNRGLSLSAGNTSEHNPIQKYESALEAANAAKNSMREAYPDLDSEAIRGLIEAAKGGTPTPEQSLRYIALSRPDRVVVLDSAYKSAERSRAFIKKKRLLDLLKTLTGDYIDALIYSGGDAEARRLFGKAYRANESHTTQGSPELMKMRTFTYEGVRLEMQKHLGIGVAHNDEETIRIYFHWDAKAQKVVIGYCGPHLPNGVNN